MSAIKQQRIKLYRRPMRGGFFAPPQGLPRPDPIAIALSNVSTQPNECPGAPRRPRHQSSRITKHTRAKRHLYFTCPYNLRPNRASEGSFARFFSTRRRNVRLAGPAMSPEQTLMTMAQY